MSGTSLLRRGPSAPRSTFVVRVVAGSGVGAQVEVDREAPNKLLVGSSPVCALRVDDEACSRRHASLSTDGETLRVQDLGSTNGTWLGKLRVFDVGLGGGETITVGRTQLHVERAVSGPASPRSDAASFGRYLGASDAIRRLFPLCEKLARSDVSVIIEGETGTGKEVLAEAIHERSARAKAPFVVFDCTTVNASLLEEALFGHERGAFTGASFARAGVFEEAHGGTLFIDEIGDLDLGLQAKLLRAIQRGEVRRIGGQGWKRVDVRVMAATRRDLDAAVHEGRFRDDLFFRLAVARIELPALRDRMDDVPLLVRHFWTRLGGDVADLSFEALERFERSAYPGNVRELENAVTRLFALGESPEALPRRSVTPASAPEGASDFVRAVLEKNMPLSPTREIVVAELERRYVDHVVARAGGNMTRAAELAGVADRHLRRLRARDGRAR